MAENTSSACAKIAACICAQDGVISKLEEEKMLSVLAKKFPDLDAAAFDRVLTEFFDSDDQIEDYLALVDDESLRAFTLKLAEESAGADGLDSRENIALQKAYDIWGLEKNV